VRHAGGYCWLRLRRNNEAVCLGRACVGDAGFHCGCDWVWKIVGLTPRCSTGCLTFGEPLWVTVWYCSKRGGLEKEEMPSPRGYKLYMSCVMTERVGLRGGQVLFLRDVSQPPAPNCAGQETPAASAFICTASLPPLTDIRRSRRLETTEQNLT
jgi:hypothetical protein